MLEQKQFMESSLEEINGKEIKSERNGVSSNDNNSSSSRGGSYYNFCNQQHKSEFYCTQCYVECNVFDLLYGDHVNHSAIYKRDVIHHAPSSLLREAQCLAQEINENFIKPYRLQEIEMTQSLETLLAAQDQTQRAIAELNKQLETIQSALSELCENKLLHECNVNTLQQTYLKSCQRLINAKNNLQRIISHNTNFSDNEKVKVEMEMETKAEEKVREIACVSSNEYHKNNSSAILTKENVLCLLETSHKLYSLNASRQLREVDTILQSVTNMLTSLQNNDYNNSNNSSNSSTEKNENEKRKYTQTLWNKWLHHALCESNANTTEKGEFEQPEPKLHTEDKEQEELCQHDIDSDMNRANNTLCASTSLHNADNFKESLVWSHKTMSAREQHNTPEQKWKQTALKMKNEITPAESVKVSRGIADCSPISEHNSTQSCHSTTLFEPANYLESLKCNKSIDFNLQDRCDMSIAELLTEELHKRMNFAATNNSNNDNMLSTATHDVYKLAEGHASKVSSVVMSSDATSMTLNNKHKQIREQYSQWKAAIENLKSTFVEDDSDHNLNEDSDTSSLIELQKSLLRQQQQQRRRQQQEKFPKEMLRSTY